MKLLRRNDVEGFRLARYLAGFSMKTICKSRFLDRGSVGRIWVVVLVALIEVVAMAGLGGLVR